jgi:hypothetical protein
MNDLLEIILYIAAAATICGLRYLSRNLHRGEEHDWVRRWLLPGGHTHHPGTPEIKREDEQRAYVAQEPVRRPRKTWAKPEEAGEPTRSRFEPPEATPPTPMYGGRPARLWWLPEQEIPKAPDDAARQTMTESPGCAKCGELNPADSAFCGECGLFLEPPESTTGPVVEMVTRRGQKAAGSRRNWQLGADRSVVKWRQGR